MKVATIVLTLPIALLGCQSISYIQENYKSAQPAKFVYPPDDPQNAQTYNLAILPDQERLVISGTVGMAAASGLVKGFSFGSIDASPAGVVFAGVAMEYLKTTGKDCKPTMISPLGKTVYEIRYSCGSD